MDNDIVIQQPWNKPITKEMISDIAAKMTANGQTVLKRGEPDTLVISRDRNGGDVLVDISSIPRGDPGKFRLMLMYEIGFRWFLGLPPDETDAKLAAATNVSRIGLDMSEG